MQQSNRRRNNNRGASQMLTGGTNDVKPQLLSFSAAQSAADTTTTTTQALPVLRNYSGGGRPQIIEVLKVFAELTNQVPAVANSTSVLSIGTKNYGTVASGSAAPDVFARFSLVCLASASGEVITERVWVRDLTDGAGNGILVATDNIYAQCSGASTTVAQGWAIRILYRIYGASVEEYVGIVQSQQ